jgi:hypothetical protein
VTPSTVVTTVGGAAWVTFSSQRVAKARAEPRVIVVSERLVRLVKGMVVESPARRVALNNADAFLFLRICCTFEGSKKRARRIAIV